MKRGKPIDANNTKQAKTSTESSPTKRKESSYTPEQLHSAVELYLRPTRSGPKKTQADVALAFGIPTSTMSRVVKEVLFICSRLCMLHPLRCFFLHQHHPYPTLRRSANVHLAPSSAPLRFVVFYVSKVFLYAPTYMCSFFFYRRSPTELLASSPVTKKAASATGSSG